METLFGLLNVAVLPWWLSMLLFPRSPATVRMVQSPWPFVGLAALYGGLLLATVAVGAAPASAGLASLAAALSQPVPFLALWMHLVTLNLFAGVWIFRDARYYGRLPRAELIATWFLGPVGLGLYLWRRRRWSSADPIRLVN